MDINFHLKLAKEAGSNSRGESYYNEYKYHCGMKENPLPFEMWKIKFDALTRLQSIPEDNPLYLAESTMKKEQELCNLLGY